MCTEYNGMIIGSLTYPIFCCILQTVLTVISPVGEGMKQAFLLFPEYGIKLVIRILGKDSAVLAFLIKF